MRMHLQKYITIIQISNIRLQDWFCVEVSINIYDSAQINKWSLTFFVGKWKRFKLPWRSKNVHKILREH